MTPQDTVTEESGPLSVSAAEAIVVPARSSAFGYGLKRRLRIMGAVLAGGLVATLLLALWLGVLVPAKQEAAGYSSNDAVYAEVMVEHNAQAVQLAALTSGRSSNQTVRATAIEVGEASVERIRELANWLKARNIPVPVAGTEALILAVDGLDTVQPLGGSGPRSGLHAHSHEGGNHGMLTDDQVDAISALDGSDFDAALLGALVDHHYGGLLPIREEIAHGQDAEIKALARYEAAAIRREVNLLNKKLATLRKTGSTR